LKISALDASNYFRGLLILIGRDGKLTDREAALVRHAGKALGFEQQFCDRAIQEVLENEHIADTLPSFSSVAIAEKFIADGLTIAFEGTEIHIPEEEWLLSTAELHGLDATWFEREKIKARAHRGNPEHLEAENLSLEHV